MAKAKDSPAAAVSQIIGLVEPFDPPDRQRILRTISTYFGNGLDLGSSFSTIDVGERNQTVPFSKEVSLTPKQFMLEKKPKTDVERVSCLAYYLTHQRGVTQFKTADLSKLNTEAAQVRFSNAAVAVDNALKQGYLAHASKGHKQLSAFGEQYVQALPDREAAKAIVAQGVRRKRRTRKPARRRSKQS